MTHLLRKRFHEKKQNSPKHSIHFKESNKRNPLKLCVNVFLLEAIHIKKIK
jgi:hypothetical protein